MLLQQNYHLTQKVSRGFVVLFFFFWGPSLHCFEHHVCIYILLMWSWDLKFGVYCVCQERFMVGFNVESKQKNKKKTGGKILLTLPASGPYFH